MDHYEETDDSSGVGLVSLLSIIFTVVILKVFVKIKIQYPKLIANGLLIFIIILAFLYVNTTIISRYAEIV